MTELQRFRQPERESPPAQKARKTREDRLYEIDQVSSRTFTLANLRSLAKMFPEIIAWPDRMGFAADFTREYVKSLGLSGAIAQAISKSIADDAALADEVSNALVHTMRGETLAVADSLSLVRLKDLVGTLGLEDQVGMLLLLGHALSESVGRADDVSAGLGALMGELEDALPVADAVVKALTKVLAKAQAEGIEVAFDILQIDDEMPKVSAVTRILRQLLPMKDRLRLGDVWDDPNIKIVVLMLQAAIKTEFRKDITEGSIPKGTIDTEAA